MRSCSSHVPMVIGKFRSSWMIVNSSSSCLSSSSCAVRFSGTSSNEPIRCTARSTATVISTYVFLEHPKESEDPVRPPPRACAAQARPSASRLNTRARAGGPSSPRSRRSCRPESRAVARLLVKRRQPRVDLRVLRTRGLLRSRSALPRLLLGLLPLPRRSCFSALRCRTSSSFREEVLQRSVGNSRRRDTSSASVLASPPRASAAAGPALLVSLRWIPGDWPKQ